ncbi:helicase-related protein [Jannaschia sp. LMIT008]|uniref:helicase-related protein n=1 Tax=Jannaschia maritima TaxID=3032585 RepID=UPI0028118115|nr:DEAD/DEAH box helicase [Jannaschia sp. LMIT008]
MTPAPIDPRDHDLLFGRDALKPGDAVVHFEHGLARYDGIERLEVDGAVHELTALTYRDDGRLKVPAREGRDFWAYGAPAAEVTLDRLKAGDWIRHRDAMIAELREAVDALMAEDRARRSHEAHPVPRDPDGLQAVVDGFRFEPTEDQVRAIEAVLDDMAQDVPMDRLLIGDVGFGKTEVALRALAATALSGRQALLAAPTTVLARQHFDTLSRRLGAAGIAVVELSRLTDDRDAALAAIADGTAQVIVGTTAVLSDDVLFDGLGLVVIDEEQRLGRDDKQALRALCPGCHVLSMTATPIPRSLAAAEIGLVAVSVLATPPRARKATETTVRTTCLDALREAVAVERDRGGQVFVVCPRIEGLADVEAALRDGLDAEALTVVHGQLPEDELEERMLRFARGEVEVLVSTTIVESGIDVPRANAMIVLDADRFGLAQLHQLRGRIGRGDVAAAMLLMSDADEDAVARLDAFAACDEIGAGFRIARMDRDHRGWGEIDGEAQSGHQSRLGIGLYRHLIRQHALGPVDDAVAA